MNNLKKLREAKKISQASVARELGVSRQVYNNYELGKRQADYETLLKLAEIFGTTIDEILTDRETKEVAAIQGIELLTPDELEKAQEFIEFLISKRQDSEND